MFPSGIPAGIPTQGYTPAGPPHRVVMCMNVISFIEGIRTASRNPFNDTVTETRELTVEEKALYSAAITTLRLYVSGEVDMGDTPMIATPEDPDDPTKQSPVLV